MESLLQELLASYPDLLDFIRNSVMIGKCQRTKNQRTTRGGRKGTLASLEQKLLFALVYQKSYPVQSMMGELFGMGQSQANQWIHNRLPILKQALDDPGYEPERAPRKFRKSAQDQKDAIDSFIAGTERRRQRPKEVKKQVLHYSGKKKIHTNKNFMIATVQKKRVSYLRQTYPGKTHDKKFALEWNMPFQASSVPAV